MRMSKGLFVLLSGLVAGSATAQPYTFVEVAREFSHGDALGFIDTDVRAALAEDGTVAFTGFVPLAFESDTPDRLYVGNGGPLTVIESASAGFDDVRAIQVNSLGQLVIEGVRSTRAGAMRGVYGSSTIGPPLGVIYEGLLSGVDPMQLPTSFSGLVSMSDNGSLAFSSISNGSGSLYLGAVTGVPAVYRAGNGTFFNNRRIDVNDAGQVAMEMEYFDPTRGLSRAILVFSAANQELIQVTTAMEKASVGFSSRLAINSAGKVAFSTNSNATLTFYDPPDDSGGTVVDVINLTAGVYLATPTAFGQPSSLTTIADGATYTNFGEVDVNDDDTVVFQASPTAGGGTGVFKGNDPVADKIIQQGDILNNELFSIVLMGELNNAGELSVITSDFNSTDRQVWKIQGIQPPPPPPLPPPPPGLRRIFRAFILLILQALGLI